MNYKEAAVYTEDWYELQGNSCFFTQTIRKTIMGEKKKSNKNGKDQKPLISISP